VLLSAVIGKVYGIPGARFTKQTDNNFYPKFLFTQSYNVFLKNTCKKYNLQESNNNFKIKLKISYCESGPCTLYCSLYSYLSLLFVLFNNLMLFSIFKSIVYALYLSIFISSVIIYDLYLIIYLYL